VICLCLDVEQHTLLLLECIAGLRVEALEVFGCS
jgi:hypothetical protein